MNFDSSFISYTGYIVYFKGGVRYGKSTPRSVKITIFGRIRNFISHINGILVYSGVLATKPSFSKRLANHDG